MLYIEMLCVARLQCDQIIFRLPKLRYISIRIHTTRAHKTYTIKHAHAKCLLL